MQQQSRLVVVDLLRIFAALSVLVFHTTYWSWRGNSNSLAALAQHLSDYRELAPFTWWGWIGVRIFFVISGFVIASSALHATASSFLKARIRRLLPGVLICATFSLSLLMFAGRDGHGLLLRYLRSIGFVPIGPWIEPTYWTLTVEVTFYALVFVLLAARRFRWLESVTASLAVAGALLWTYAFLFPGAEALRWQLLRSSVQPLLLPTVAFFAVGVFMWLGLNRGWTWWRLIIVAIAILGGVLEINANATRSSAGMPVTIVPALPVVVWLLALAALLFVIPRDAWLANRLGPRLTETTRLLGLATYPLYLIHYSLSSLILGYGLSMGLHRYLALLISLLVPILFAVGITVYLEPLVRSLGSLFWRRRPLAAPPPAAS